MSRSREGAPARGRGAGASERRPSKRRVILVVAGMLAVSLTVGALFGQRGLLELLRYRGERARLLEEIAELEESIASLEEEVRALDEDPLATERIAREELGMGRPGEVLVLLPREPPRDPRRSPGWTSPRDDAAGAAHQPVALTRATPADSSPARD